MALCLWVLTNGSRAVGGVGGGVYNGSSRGRRQPLESDFKTERFLFFSSSAEVSLSLKLELLFVCSRLVLHNMQATRAKTQTWFLCFNSQLPLFHFPISSSVLFSSWSSFKQHLIIQQLLCSESFLYLRPLPLSLLYSPLVFPIIPRFIFWLLLVMLHTFLNSNFLLIHMETFAPWTKVQEFCEFPPSLSPSLLFSCPCVSRPSCVRPYILSSSLSSPSICVSLTAPCIPLSSVQLHCNPGRQQDLELTGEMRWWNGMTSVVSMCVCVCMCASAASVCVCSMNLSSGSH